MIKFIIFVYERFYQEDTLFTGGGVLKSSKTFFFWFDIIKNMLGALRDVQGHFGIFFQVKNEKNRLIGNVLQSPKIPFVGTKKLNHSKKIKKTGSSPSFFDHIGNFLIFCTKSMCFEHILLLNYDLFCVIWFWGSKTWKNSKHRYAWNFGYLNFWFFSAVDGIIKT